jgi:hypothetical protein
VNANKTSIEAINSGMKGNWQYSNRGRWPQGVAYSTAFGSMIYASSNLTLANGQLLSPTVFRKQGFRFSFFSNEEPRMHVHVYSGDGDAKFWLEPTIELAQNKGLRPNQITKALQLIRENENEIRSRWRAHFGS